MTDVLSAMEYPHWLIVAGAILAVLGLIGLAIRQRKSAEVKLPEMANENEQGRSRFEAELAQLQANRKAKLAEQTRGRWANKDRGFVEELLNDKPKPSEEPK